MKTHLLVFGLLVALIGLPLLSRAAAATAPPSAAPAPAPRPPAPAPAAAPRPVPTSSVLVYIKFDIARRFGLLAHLLGGRRDSIVRYQTFDAARPWWRNPLLVYDEAPLAGRHTTLQVDAARITGRGSSANVTVTVNLVPHAQVAISDPPGCDAVRGRITAIISAVAEYYDGHWTPMLHQEGLKVTFPFNTCDPHRPVQVVGHESRVVPSFSLERYTRARQKWQPKSHWPAQPKNGDWWVVIHGKDATLQFTRYRYCQPKAVAQAPALPRPARARE